MRNDMLFWKRPKWLPMLEAAVCLTGVVLHAQSNGAPALAAGCVKENVGIYRCGPEPFQSRLASAHSVAIEAGPMDRFTYRELRRLAERLGKEVASSGQTADLTITIVPVTQGAISIGLADRPLASLLVYARSGQEGHGTLVWCETFTGQPDRPWPMVVRAVIDQFQGRAQAQGRVANK